jgi:apolipoprotein N-acyltransferase
VPHVTHGADDLRAAGFLLAFPTGVALFIWCKLNAAERQIVPPAVAPLLVGVLAPIGVPFYFLRTLPLRSALLAIGKAVLFFCGLNLTYALAQYLSSGLAV